MPKRILIVEDEKPLLNALTDKLSREGFEIITAVDGGEAWEKARTEKPDLVLLDLMLPVISGEQVLKNIRQNKETKSIPVIVISAKGDDADIRHCLDFLGANDYLVKTNYTLEEILKKVNKILS